MRAIIPVRPLSVLAGQRNGELDPAILVDAGDGNLFVAPAATAARRMFAAAKADGITLEWDNTYRPLASQEQLVLARYTTTWITGQPSLWWRNARWWLIPGNDIAATPGTSNHGWGRAGDLTRASRVGAALTWLEAHAVEHGFSWEEGIADREPWHLRYFAGDDPPDPRPAPPPPAAGPPATTEDDDDMATVIHHPIERPDAPGTLDFTRLVRAGEVFEGRRYITHICVRSAKPHDAPFTVQVHLGGQPPRAVELTWGVTVDVEVTAGGMCSVVGPAGWVVAEAREIDRPA